MRKFYCSFLFAVAIASSFDVKAQSVNHLVISQVYGGGGNSGAPYSNDFVELFNPTANTISLSGMSIQYASSTGTSWTNKVNLTGSVGAGKYFLIQLASTNTLVGSALPTPDLIGTINMSGTSGKVALMNSTISMTGSGCPIASPIIDFVGYGSADCSEGSSPVAALSNTAAAIRKSNGCTDTDNNSSDFSTGAPVPRNSTSAANICGILTPTIGVTSTSLTGFTTTTGVQSASQTVAITGMNLNDLSLITIVATSPYEISVNNSDFSTFAVLQSINGFVSGAINIRISASAPAGAANGSVTISYNGATYFTISLSGTVMPSSTTVAAPQSFTASAVSTSEIDLTATGNANGNSIVVAFNTTSSFGTPSGTLTAGNSISGGGTVLYSGPSAAFNYQHTGLTASTTYYYSIWSVDALNNYSTSLTANATTNALLNPKVVINQIYGGGGNSGSTYRNDFIELYNNENIAVNLSGWSVQYQSAAGTGAWQVTPLTGTIPAHGFYLVQEAAGTGGTVSLPSPDNTGSIAMAAGAGKVILSNATTAVSGANPTGNNVIDKVGYGSTATGFETSPATGPDNTMAVKRSTDGLDNNNNSTDFVLFSPQPRNSPYTITGPAIVSLTPPDNSMDVPQNVATSIIFDKTVVKGTGTIVIYENGQALAPIDVNSASVTVTNKTVTINFSYVPGKAYYINIDAGTFLDIYGNSFAGITGTTAWNFTMYNSNIVVTTPALFDFQNCVATGLLSNGFTQFNEKGSIAWDCTPFGRDPAAPSGTAQFPNAVQINGFANGTNVSNIDWLITPTIDLSSTTYPLLSFWSRTAFNGLPLQLKISIDYPGTGDPRNYTWTDLNGKFPLQASNVWTLSSDINLSAFKQANVHIAFVYKSTDDDGARWTIDDVGIINSPTPPPPSLTVGISDIQFGYVANGTTGDKTFSFIGNDLTENITVSSSGEFLVSKDGSNFSSSTVYTVAEANNLSQTVYVRFVPAAAEQDFSGIVTVSTTDNIRTITTKGTSIDPATTLEVVNWNMEWFGSTTMAPNNDDQQEQNAETILKNVSADIFGLVEVVDETRLARVVSHMPGYSYVMGNFGSHVNPPDPTGGSLTDAQKLAFVYKTSLFSNVSARPLINNQNTSSTSYNNWSSGRYPFLMKADVTLNGISKTINFVLIHAKANTSPTNTSYNRRQASAQELHDTLMQYFANENVIMLGDFNDDLDQSITAGFTTTSYSSFTNDPSNFFSPTLALSIAGKKSTVSYNDMIDHVMLTNDMQPWYMPGSATVLSDVSSLVTNYGSTTTDHYPVFTRYMFCKLTTPSDITMPNDQGQCGAIVNFNTGATMTCGTVAATPVSGSFFPIGTTTVNLTTSTGDTASFKVTVTDDEKPVITAPVAITVNTDAGQCQTSKDNVNLGTATLSDNCSATTITNDAPSVFPVGTTTVTWTATDASGNTAIATQLITIEDHELPGIVQPQDITVGAETGKCSATVTLQAPQTTDNCGLASVTNNVPVNGVYTVGSHIVTWTATDIHGNSTTATQKVTINDNENPIITNCPVIPVLCYNAAGSYTIPAISATDNCGTVSFNYVISGATTRTGNSSNASGIFIIGVSTITWTVTDSHNNTTTCQTIVIVNSPVLSNIPDVYAVNPGGAANTIYIGYGADSVTLNAGVSGGAGSYTYKWTIGSSAGPALNNLPLFKVSPALTTTYYLNVKDVYGCSAPVVTKTVYVTDVRCGPKLDKVTVCSVVKGKLTTSCILQKDVASALTSGTLGSCVNSALTTRTNSDPTMSPLLINAMPNPSAHYFTVAIEGGSVSEKIFLQVTDMLGRVVEQKTNLQTNSTIQIGTNYRPGTYIAEVIQGSVRKQIKLVKL